MNLRQDRLTAGIVLHYRPWPGGCRPYGSCNWYPLAPYFLCCEKPMPRLTAHVDEAVKQQWRELALERGVSESALIGAVLTAAVNQLASLDLRPFRNRDRGGEFEKIDLRLTPAENKLVRQAAKADGLPSRQAWIIALVRGRLMDVPTPNAAELDALRESNRQLLAIGRNLNQLAHAANIDFRHATSVTGETLDSLRVQLIEHQKKVRALIQSTLGRWTGRWRERGGEDDA